MLLGTPLLMLNKQAVCQTKMVFVGNTDLNLLGVILRKTRLCIFPNITTFL